jgi:CRISPR-associated protein Csc3
MPTLLQTLIIETLPEETDPILRAYIDTILPAMEREYALITALGGSEKLHLEKLEKLGDKFAHEKAKRWSNNPDQSLLVHVLNALLTAWNLSEYLPNNLQLSDTEKRLLCLSITLHDYDKAERGQKEETQPPKAHEIQRIIEVCRIWGKKLNFQAFWDEWQDYLLDIAFLAQNTQFNVGSNPIISIWEQASEQEFQLDDRRLDTPLRNLLAFGDIAVHMNDPGDIVTTTRGVRLQDHLTWLGIKKKLVYHRLRDCRGLLTNQIHNAIVGFVSDNMNWDAILYFAYGTVYLSSPDSGTPDFSNLKDSAWEGIIGDLETNQKGLIDKFSSGDVGFVRDGKGLKVAPQTLELFSPAELICLLPDVVQAKVNNIKTPATPKRLEHEKLNISKEEKQRLIKVSDIRADRIAEFLILTQSKFFSLIEEYALYVLNLLELNSSVITPEQTAVQSGGVNYGWYYAAACYIANHPTLNEEETTEFLKQLAQNLAKWGEEKGLLQAQNNSTREAFSEYLDQYLEFSGHLQPVNEFQNELTAYSAAKVSNKPICSLSSGEFAAEDQLDSVVLFKPQQYSNKNALGGGRIKRGISKIWSLEMLLRQAYWSVPAGKLEEQQPIFLYIFPAYVYSPQVAKAVKLLAQELKKTNLWEVRSHWRDAFMQSDGLQTLHWREEAEAGRFRKNSVPVYSTKDLPFMAMTYTVTRGKTTTDAWVEPTFLALALPRLLGVKVVASPSPEPVYSCDKEFTESVKLDGAASFWNLMGLDSSLHVPELEAALQKLLTAYSIHLDNRSAKPDARWQAFNGTVRDLATDILNVFGITNERLRREKREPSQEDVQCVWKFAEIWAKGDKNMQERLEIIQRLVREYRKFYQVGISDSSHTILLPLSKALEVILTVPNHITDEDLILQGAGQLKDAIDRREVYHRPFLLDKSVEYTTRQALEIQAIHAFMTTCVNELFGTVYKHDRALLQENRNRIKSGAEFAYRLQTMQEKLIS